MGAGLRTPYEVLQASENIDNYQLRLVFCDHIHAFKQGRISDEKYRLICRAYECLSDYRHRKHYDETGKWLYKLPLSSYTLQQLAAEPALLINLKNRLKCATFREINAQDPLTGHTALYSASRAGNLMAVIYLIEKGAEPDLSQRTNSTALHVGAFYAHADVVQCLLESGADYRIKNAFHATAEEESRTEDVKQVFIQLKRTPFVQAAANQLDWFKENITQITQHIDEQYFVQRQTLLHCASKRGYIDLVRWLVEERSSNLDIVDINLNSALHLAASHGHASVVKYLLECGANSFLINKRNMTAEQEGEHHDAKITEIFRSIRQRDMFSMAINGTHWWFQYHFGKNSPNTVDATGTSILYIACRYGQTLVAKWLLDHGANVNQQLEQNTGSTPLHGAAFHGHISTVELLLAYGADVNIKNNFGATVFDETKPECVQRILEQYRGNLKNDKLMAVHVYLKKINRDTIEELIVKIHLRYDAKQKDLFEALPDTINREDGYFSIAKRPLWFESQDTTILTAVCRARYVRSKFIEIPLRLTFTSGKIPVQGNHRSKMESTFNYSMFIETFERLSQSSTMSVDASTSTTEQIFTIGPLQFSIAAGSNDKDVSIDIKSIDCSNFNFCQYGLPECLCLFKTTYESRRRLKEPPIVSFLNEPNVRLYTLALPSPFWFTYDTRQKRLPIIEGIHAFFRHVDIIPALLSLPADMFLTATFERPLTTRNDPVPCKYLELRPQNTNTFPLIAYHGTRIDALQSIITDGLVVPGTLVANGLRVKPPAHHIPLYIHANHVPNFANAIFLSPSIYYGSHSIYATSFEYEGKRLLPVLECSVKTDSYTTHKGTIPHYTAHPTDDVATIEWRINNPTDIEINAILFVIKEFDQRK